MIVNGALELFRIPHFSNHTARNSSKFFKIMCLTEQIHIYTVDFNHFESMQMMTEFLFWMNYSFKGPVYVI